MSIPTSPISVSLGSPPLRLGSSVLSAGDPCPVSMLFVPQEFFNPRCLHDGEKQLLRQFLAANPTKSMSARVDDRMAIGAPPVGLRWYRCTDPRVHELGLVEVDWC